MFTVLNAPAHSEKSQSRMLRIIFLSQIFGILELIIILSFNFTICQILFCGILFLLIVFHIPLCNVRQPYTGCPFTCNLPEITRNETVWRMRTNNVKRVNFILYLSTDTYVMGRFEQCHPKHMFKMMDKKICTVYV